MCGSDLINEFGVEVEILAALYDGFLVHRVRDSKID